MVIKAQLLVEHLSMWHEYRQSFSCDACGRYVTGSRHDPICMSIIYNPGEGGDLEICQRCSRREEEAEEQAGTNELPELLATYKRSRS
jgi:ribosome-binding protein aMBF1 (putative translation factor)